MRTSTLVATIASIFTLAQCEAVIKQALGGCQLRQNPPSGSICGRKGTLRRPAAFEGDEFEAITAQAAVAETLQQCRDKASALYLIDNDPPGAFSFSWDSSQNVCTFYPVVISQQRPRFTKRGSVMLYDSACFECNDCTGTTTLYNGNFEGGTTGPWFFFGNTTGNSLQASAGGPTRNSRFYAALSNTNPNPPSLVGQFFTYCPGTQYQLDFDYKFFQRPNVERSFTAVAGSQGGQIIDQTFNNTAGPRTWKHGTLPFILGAQTLPQGRGGVVYFYGENDPTGAATYGIDNIVLSIIPF